ncbi:MAG: hypothetical protein LIO85_01920 [Rikenellaceae bacterium]|nr:hypothetical protein [Rikenellaceae bacterium]
MARIKLGSKIEMAVLALTLAVQLTKLIREHLHKPAPEPVKPVAPANRAEPAPIKIKE